MCYHWHPMPGKQSLTISSVTISNPDERSKFEDILQRSRLNKAELARLLMVLGMDHWNEYVAGLKVS